MKASIYKYDILFAGVIAFIVIYALAIGFLSPDSVNYLIMADIGNAGALCSKNGEFYGVFACGYPAFIKLFSYITNDNLFLASKLFNAFALLCFYFIFVKIFASRKLALLAVFVPFNLYVATYTWSENAVLLSLSLYLCALHRIKSTQKTTITTLLIVFISIIIGCFSRFSFAPFSVVIFICSYFVVGRHTLKLLIPFALCGFIFVAYKVFAASYDMERIAAPESFTVLVSAFALGLTKMLIAFGLFLLPLLIVKYKKIEIVSIFKFTKPSWALFFVSMGIGYLIICFLMRSLIQYDLFSIRLVGFGLSLICIGFLIFWKNEIDRLNAVWVVSMIAISFVASSVVVPNKLKQIAVLGMVDQGAVNSYIHFQQNARGKIVIPIGQEHKTFPFGPYVAISEFNSNYPSARFQRIPMMPYAKKKNVAEFIASLDGQDCEFWFSPSLTQEQLINYLAKEYKVAHNKYVNAVSDELREYVLDKYRTKNYNCYN